MFWLVTVLTALTYFEVLFWINMDNLARSFITLVVAISFLVAPGQVTFKMLQLLSNTPEFHSLKTLLLKVTLVVSWLTSFPYQHRDQKCKWIAPQYNLFWHRHYRHTRWSTYLPVNERGIGPEWKHPSPCTLKVNEVKKTYCSDNEITVKIVSQKKGISRQSPSKSLFQ